MSDLRLPAAVNVEEAMLAAMMLTTSNVATAVEFLSSEDFTNETHQLWFDTIVGLWKAGGATDPASVAAKVGSLDRLTALQHGAVMTQRESVQHYARLLVDTTTARNLALLGKELSLEACTTDDPYVLAEQTADRLAAIDAPAGKIPDDLYDGDTLMELASERPMEWVLPGLMRYGWRALIVAFEGRGKSYLLTQLATGLAHGVQTLTGEACPPAPALLVDLENPRDEVAQRVRTVTNGCRSPRVADLRVWCRPAGIDLRARRDRSEFEAVLTACRPALVCMGPLYKAYHVGARERDEEAAVATQAVLDGLRARFGFALLMEHHAPHAESGSKRQARPIGSSAWLRWPELGYGWVDSKERRGSLDRSAFRGDRVNASWPQRLDRGDRFPWVGRWDEAKF